MALYKGVKLNGKTKMTLKAQSTLREDNLRVLFGDFSAEVRLIPSDSFDDFSEYTIEIPEQAQISDTVRLIVPDSVGVLDVTFK